MDIRGQYIVIVPWTTDLDPYLWCWLISNFGDLTVRAAELIRFVFAQDLFMRFTLCMLKVWEKIFLLMRRIQYLVNTWLMSCIWSFISSTKYWIWSFISSILYSDRRHVLYLPSHFLCTKNSDRCHTFLCKTCLVSCFQYSQSRRETSLIIRRSPRMSVS